MGACINGEKNGHAKKEMRVMLLGIGGSGKTTFSKQMQFIHQGSFDEEHAKVYKNVLLTNILVGLKSIAAHASDLQESENYKKSRWVQSLDESSVTWDDELKEKVKSLWRDQGIQDAWKEVKDTTILQMEYLMDNIDRFLEPQFIPNNDDILRARQRTTGEAIYVFEDPKTIWHLTDVGGQFNERQKWNDYFTSNTSPNAIIFFLALDEYNIPNTELNTQRHPTKFSLAMDVFRSIMADSDGPVVTYKLCRIVFLNKIDLFTEKIKVEKKFLEFKEVVEYGGEADAESCAAHVADRLREVVMKEDKQKVKEDVNVKIHVTNALDTKLMQSVSADIKVSILTYTLRDLGMMV